VESYKLHVIVLRLDATLFDATLFDATMCLGLLLKFLRVRKPMEESK